jgi:hypothetical protein
MNTWSLEHLEDNALLRALTRLVTEDRATTAALLAHIVEVEERRLYLYAACSSMFVYCKRILHMSEGATYKRIQVARAARRFPALFDAIAEGRLHLSAVVVLAPHLTPANAEELLAAATHQTRAEVEALIAMRFPKPDVATIVRPLMDRHPAAASLAQVVANIAREQSPGTVVPSDACETANGVGPLSGSFAMHEKSDSTQRHAHNSESHAAQDHVSQTELAAPGHASPVPSNAESRARLTALSPGRYAVQVTVDQETHDLLREAKELLGHSVPSGDVAEVLKRALALLVQKLKAQKYGSRSRPRPQDGEPNGRHVPAEIRRIVSERDGDQCTFRSADGRRCEARSPLELDHIRPFACGGRTTVANLRLLCRPHNLHMARFAYGGDHVRERQEASRREAARTRAQRQPVATRQHRLTTSQAAAPGRSAGATANERQRLLTPIAAPSTLGAMA